MTLSEIRSQFAAIMNALGYCICCRPSRLASTLREVAEKCIRLAEEIEKEY